MWEFCLVLWLGGLFVTLCVSLVISLAFVSSFVLCSSDSPEGLDVYMHILQLLTTVDEGIQAIGKTLELLLMMGLRMQVASSSSDV